MKDGKELVELAIAAHGGKERWSQVKILETHYKLGGVIWTIKGQEGVLSEVTSQIELHQQRFRNFQFVSADQQSIFEPDRVAIETQEGQVLDELIHPRESFAGYHLETPWNKLQLIYFNGYAIWTYLTSPFSFTLPGFKLVELETWPENGEIWRRLQVTFPSSIATHTATQIFYFNQAGLLKRHDYEVDILAGASAVRYMSNFTTIQGLQIPFTHRIYSRNEEGSFKPEPILVTIDIDRVEIR
ncbi:hypothetical protein [Spirosoma endbachense]|uniref:Uncharacterized protein n=1 Tax=Spirosoma endbachense TaxID=2666025 RepID=A0A6P1W1U4_9BACT|nr:hypothetical protein [Spirosoma endbachense]QHV99383.1 hypothetical protein GJR95_32150 [Spirosoma endbachense]